MPAIRPARIRSRAAYIAALCAALAATPRNEASAQAAGGGFALRRVVVASGGGTSTGGAFSLSGTVGQAEAQPVASGGSFALRGGYWAESAAVVVRDDPLFANGFENP